MLDCHGLHEPPVQLVKVQFLHFLRLEGDCSQRLEHELVGGLFGGKNWTLLAYEHIVISSELRHEFLVEIEAVVLQRQFLEVELSAAWKVTPPAENALEVESRVQILPTDAVKLLRVARISRLFYHRIVFFSISLHAGWLEKDPLIDSPAAFTTALTNNKIM